MSAAIGQKLSLYKIGYDILLDYESLKERGSMISRTSVASILFLALTSGSASADFGGDTRDAELKSFDIELNSVYVKIIQRLDPNAQQKLKAAQRAWLQMRDLDCSWAYSDKRDCLIDRTVNRTNELKNTYFNSKNGKYESVD